MSEGPGTRYSYRKATVRVQRALRIVHAPHERPDRHEFDSWEPAYRAARRQEWRPAGRDIPRRSGAPHNSLSFSSILPITTHDPIENTDLTSYTQGNILAGMRFDVHVHTRISPCSVLSTEEVLDQARALGLDGVCITDHDSMEIRHVIREGLQPNGLCVIFGMEYGTPHGDFLVFAPFDEVPMGLPAADLLRWVDDTGGVAVAAHPFRQSRPTQEYLVRDGLCRIVEGVNGRNKESENDKVENWRERYPIQEVGGSDAHSFAELGQVVTHFSDPIRSREDLIDALKNGTYRPEALNGHKLPDQVYGRAVLELNADGVAAQTPHLMPHGK